jgi:hypothetical protein
LTSRVQNLAAKVLIRAAKEESLQHPGPIGYGAVMVTINSGTTVLRSTPASMPIQGAPSGVMLAIAIAELSVSSDRLYEQQPVPGTTRKLVSLWLYWTPNQPERIGSQEASQEREGPQK